MYKHVLVPVSFEEDRDAAGAVEVARLLTGEAGQITLLHVIEQVPSFAISYVPQAFLTETRKAVTAELAEMAAGIAGASSVVVDGHAGRTITDWAAENAVDLIVIAGHRPGMQDVLLGSTASQVVRHAACAVHVVR